MGHLLGYARVSTTDQQPQLQVDALERAGSYRVFTETASGTRTERPTLEQLLDQLRPGDTLVVWKLDRLGRSLRHLVDTVTGLAERGVGFCSLQEAIDTTTPGGKLVFHVFAALAEFERDLIRERTNAGLAAARVRGRHGGRPPVMTGQKLRVAQEMFQLDPRACGTSRRTRPIAATSWVTVSWVATASARIVESSTRRPRPLSTPVASTTWPTASKSRRGRSEARSRARQDTSTVGGTLIVQPQPAGHLPGDVARQRTDRLPVRQPLQGLQHHHRSDHPAGTDGCPPPWRATSTNSSGGNRCWRWSARKAYTDPSGSRWRHQVAASNCSSDGWLAGVMPAVCPRAASGANARIGPRQIDDNDRTPRSVGS
jgi:DNA invertase Pin-like site-specific DNA recombinase